MANAATIQLVDAQGRPMKKSLKGHEGIKPGSKVVVSGKVQQADEQVFVVNLDKLAFVKQTE